MIRFTASLVLIFVCSIGSVWAADPLSSGCVPTATTKTLDGPKDHNVLDGDGYVATIVSAINMAVEQISNSDCQTMHYLYLNDFHIYNRTQGGFASMQIDFFDAYGRKLETEYWKNYGVPRGFCGPYDPPHYKAFHLEWPISENTFRNAASFTLTSSRLGAPQGRCFTLKRKVKHS